MSLLYETETAILPAVDASAGLVSGFAGVCVSQPFDTIRVRSQVLQTSVLQTIRGTVALGAAVGLYRGVVPALCATTIVSTTVFTSLEFAKRSLSTLRGDSSTLKSPLVDTFLGGCFSGMVVSTLTSPLHRVKVQLQANNLNGRHAGHTVNAAISCGKSVLKHEGFFGLYLGWRTQFLSETVGRGVYFGTYETCKRTFWLAEKEEQVNIPLYGRIISGAASGIVGWTVIYPIDVIKNRIQAQVIRNNVKLSWLEVGRSLYRDGGVLAFYRGWSVVMFRALPVSSIALPTYDLVHLELTRRNQFY
jgi:solute carrier family 25 (mitochondrial carnitine/acylcarnitine transporter), member 20/29